MQVEKMINNFSYFSKPLANSACSKINKRNSTNNIYCNLIKDIYDDIVSRYEEDIPLDYCSLHGPCLFEPPRHLTGVNCAHCLATITYTFEAQPENRESTLKNYCSTAFGSLISFCNGIEYIVSKSLKKQFLNYQSATKFCIKAAFCQYDDSEEYSDL